MGRPAVKKNRKEAEARAYGEALGKYKAMKKVRLIDALKAKAIDMIDKIDPLKLSAIIAIAYISKATLDNSQVIASRLTSSKYAKGISAMPFLMKQLGIDTWFNETFIDTDQGFEWLICFSFAYLVVEKPEILKEFGEGVVDFALKVIPK